MVSSGRTSVSLLKEVSFYLSEVGMNHSLFCDRLVGAHGDVVEEWSLLPCSNEGKNDRQLLC